MDVDSKPKQCMGNSRYFNFADEWQIGSEKNRPIAVIVVGMAGSGKTTLMQVTANSSISALNFFLETERLRAYKQNTILHYSKEYMLSCNL